MADATAWALHNAGTSNASEKQKDESEIINRGKTKGFRNQG